MVIFLKNKVLEIYNEYKNKFIKYFYKFKRKVLNIKKITKKYFSNIKENLLKKENRKKYLKTTGLLIIINLLLINIFISYAYYRDEDSLSMIKTQVGDLLLYKYDSVIRIFKESIDSTGKGSGEYYVTDMIPNMGYNYSGYNCKNNSTLIYDEVTKTTSVTIDQKERCELYFDVIGSVDIKISIMLEEGFKTENYVIGERIPAYGYTYSHYECANEGKIEYNSERHSVKLSATGQENCSLYFNKKNSDIDLNLYIEETYNFENYIKSLNIPSGNIYSLNNEKSFCKNTLNERLDTTINYIDGYIDLGVGEISSCDIYLDLYE